MNICDFRINGLVLGGIADLILGELKQIGETVSITIDEPLHIISFKISGEAPLNVYVFVEIYGRFIEEGRNHYRMVCLGITVNPLNAGTDDVWRKLI